jgi:hypothetical protein
MFIFTDESMGHSVVTTANLDVRIGMHGAGTHFE